MESTRLKALFLGILGLLAMVVIFGFIGSLSHNSKSETIVEVAPSTAQVTIDGKSVQPGTIYLGAGNHTVVASLDNFASDEQHITTKSGKPSNIVIMLSPANDAGRKYLADNPTYQMQREGIAGRDIPIAETPLLKLLPTTSSEIPGPYAIDYGASSSRPNGTVIIITDSSPSGRAKALKWLRGQGFEPTNLEIQFNDFVNPLALTYTGGGE